MSQNKYQVLASNTIIFAIGNILVKLISFFLMPLYTSILTAEQYGVAELLNSSIEIVLPIMTLCIIDALYRFSIDKDIEPRSLFTNAAVTVLIGDLLVCSLGAAVFLVTKYEYTMHFCLLYISITFYKLTTQFARGLGHAKRFSLYGVLNALLLVLSNYILLVKSGCGIKGYLISFAIGYAVSGITALACSSELCYFSIYKFDKLLLKSMLRYSVPETPNMLSWWVNSLSDRYIVLFFWGPSLTGLYAAASKLPALVNVGTTIFQQAWQFSTAVEVDTKSEDKSAFFSNVFKVYSGGCILLCTFLVLINKIICKILLKSDFYSAWKFVPLLLLAAMFGAFSTYFGTFYNAIKDNNKLMVSTLLGATVNIVLNFLLIPKSGGIGAAIATVISYALIAIIRAKDIIVRMCISVNYQKLGIQITCLILYVVWSSLLDSYVTYIVGLVLMIGLLATEYKTIQLLINKFFGALRRK